jgi:hypothetical protein
VPALCSVLGTGDDEPVSIDVLKALYTIISPDSSGGSFLCWSDNSGTVWYLGLAGVVEPWCLAVAKLTLATMPLP